MNEKLIHYVWMGRGEKPPLTKMCMESWKKFLPHFEWMEWSEDNFDIHSNPYVQEAYKNKKWAFVSDYIRLYALKNYGGIYLDTDVEVLKPLDDLLKHDAFSGFESQTHIPTGIMGAKKNHVWINELISHYTNRSFYKKDGTMDLTPNIVPITRQTIEKFGLNPQNSYQELKNNLVIYPKQFFCPSDYEDALETKRKKVSKESYTIHHFNGSWLTPWGKLKVKIRKTYMGRCLKKIIQKR